MRKPMLARSTAARLALLCTVAVLLGACGESNTPPSARRSTTPEATSMFVPDAASKALFGVADGTYVVTFDPKKDQAFYLGPNHLNMPANSVCNLLTSGYGSQYWDAPCTPQTQHVTLTVTIKNAASDHPSVEFQPAMRFNPAKVVQLFMYVPNATLQDASNWLMLYCPTGSATCVDESKTDPSLTSYVDRSANVVFRRIKHFSGYVITGYTDTPPDDLVLP